MNWWPFAKEPEVAAKDGPQAPIEEIERRAKQYLDDADGGKLIYPACKRCASDAAGDEPSICDHSRLEAFRYLLSVPRKEFALLGDPDQQALLLDGYLRQLPHDQTVIEFTGNTAADLSIATIAGFTGWFIAPSSPARIRRNFTERSAISAG